MIVVDASAVISGLLNDGPARRALSTEHLHAPHLIDAEVANGMRRLVAQGSVTNEDGWAALDILRTLGISRHPVVSFLDRIWELRHNLSANDASYVSLAESLDCGLLTADARIGAAPTLRCAVTVIPR